MLEFGERVTKESAATRARLLHRGGHPQENVDAEGEVAERHRAPDPVRLDHLRDVLQCGVVSEGGSRERIISGGAGGKGKGKMKEQFGGVIAH